MPSTSEQNSSAADSGAPVVPPHTPLTGYYGRTEERERYVGELFNETAKYYNTIEAIFGNIGLWYRRFSLKRHGIGPGMKVLDVAIGTAAVSRGAVKLVGPDGQVFGVDPSIGMMSEARKNFSGPLTQGVAQALPFKSDHFDFVTMGIALRHVPDLVQAFSEYCRVLQPGGRVWILEGHLPKSKLGIALTRFGWAKLVPWLTLLFTRSQRAKELMDYYWDTVENCVPPEKIVGAMQAAGFEDVRSQLIIPGGFIEYSGRKPG